ncbi:hypothetical protein JCM10207_005501 [Rhodosporidiobolus poonsookiae]
MLATQDVLVTLTCVGAAAFLRWRDWKEQHPRMRIERLFLYPIKGLRPLEPESVELCVLGFKFDRRFILVSPKEDGSHECHLASQYPSHSLLRQSIDPAASTLTITASSGETYTTVLQPDTDGRKPFTVDLHGSPVLAFDMGDKAAAFFTKQSEGKETRLMFLDESVSGAKHGRKVLGSISDGKDNGIGFQDCASYMIGSAASLGELSKTLGREMSVLPLRPNMLLGPATPSDTLKPYVEDFWGELRLAGKTTIRLTSNCVRCISLNIDYSSGKRLEGTGLPLQALAKERRVDAGSYSPVFGRYGFSHDVGHKLSVGDTVEVTKINKARTVFSWPGMG